MAYIDGVQNPIAVHYGWADDAGDCNLYNKEKFPATSFRTDDWAITTKDQKYWLLN
jgi:sialate O-acetylesterase